MKVDTLERFVRDVEGAADAIIREDYTHYTKDGQNVTKLRSPDGLSALAISTSKVAGKIVGKTQQELIPGVKTIPYNTFLQSDKAGNMKVYWNSKAQGERPITPWLERALNDHLRHFYKA